MMRLNRRTAAAGAAAFLLLALLTQSTRAGQTALTADKAAPAGAKTTAKALGEKAATPAADHGRGQTNDGIPVPSCDRIDYSRPEAYVPLGRHIGNKDHVLKVAAAIRAKTPRDELVSIYRWVHSNLVYKSDVPYEWRDFDRLVFYSEKTKQSAEVLSGTLFPELTHHFTSRPHSANLYREQFPKWTKPDDTIILFLLADEKERIPAEFQDLLPKSWSEVEAEVTRKGAIRYDGESRRMHIVLLVAKSPAELASLIREIQW